MVFDRERTGWHDHTLQRLALLEGQLLQTREAIGRARHNCDKALTRSSTDFDTGIHPLRVQTSSEELAKLERREALLTDKIKGCLAEYAEKGGAASTLQTAELRPFFRCRHGHHRRDCRLGGCRRCRQEGRRG